MDLSPVVLFVYNRLEHTKETIAALLKNDLAESTVIYIFSDAAKTSNEKIKVDEVRAYLRTVNGFKDKFIVEREYNLGLAKSIISGVSEVIKNHGKTIVLEDDIVTSKDFLRYMNDILNFYKDEKRVFSVTGSNYLQTIPKDFKSDVFAFSRASSWGWGTWRDRWESVDWEMRDFKSFSKNRSEIARFNKAGDDMYDTLFSYMKGRIDVWAIRWCYAHFKNNAKCIYPTISKVTNIGLDGSGQNCTIESSRFFSSHHEKDLNLFCDLDKENPMIVDAFFQAHKYDLKRKCKRLIKKIIGYYNI